MSSKITQAVLLSAGLGTRLREVTGDTLPKVMVPLLGKPLLEWHIEALKEAGITDFYINLFYLPEKITDYFGDGKKWGVKITYVREEPEIRGTAGGVKNFEKFLGDAFLVLYGDTFYEVDYRGILEFYASLKDPAGMLTIRTTDHPLDSDLVVVGDDNKVAEFLVKPHKELPKNYWGTSAPYILSKQALAYVPEGKYYEIAHNLVPDLLKRGCNYYAYKLKNDEFRKDIGTPDRYHAVEEYLKKKKASA